MRNLLGIALAGFLMLGVAGSAGAATLPYTGTLTFQLSALPGLDAPGGGVVALNGTAGGAHLSSLVISAGDLGPVNASLPVTSNSTINSVIFTAMANASGTPLVGGVGGAMGLTGTAKICLVFAPCAYAAVTVPLTGGLGIGGTQSIGGDVAITMQHNPWTIGQPTMTIHTANSTVTVPTLPGGFAHGAGTATSTTAQPSGVVQLVTVSKTYTSLTDAFPELPIMAILELHFAPEPGSLLLLISGVGTVLLLGGLRRRRP